MELTRIDVNSLFTDALWCMKSMGVEEESRNGMVKTIQGPMTLATLKPMQRVIFCAERKENPQFHFAECLWMMAGRGDAAWLAQFNPRMAEFAEKDGNIHGAYGYRWRKHFFFDQIVQVCKELKANPWSRRVVLSMWTPDFDLGSKAKDVPCNTHIYFRRRGTALDMTVCNRSNDLVWGALGSNIVHFSFLMELIAHEVGLNVGTMYQITNNLHIYERHWHFLDIPPECEQYIDLGIRPYPLIIGRLATWLVECEAVVSGERRAFTEPFFNEVAIPILEGDYDNCKALDWKYVCKRVHSLPLAPTR